MGMTRVLIIGGGPAGATLAHKLSSTNIEAEVYDMPPPRGKVCGWAVPEFSISRIGMKIPGDMILNRIKSVMIHGKFACYKLSFKEPVLYIVNRMRWHRYILENSGADINYQLFDMSDIGRIRRKYDYIALASGYTGAVWLANRIALRIGWNDIHIGYQYIINRRLCRGDEIHIYYDISQCPHGYFWVFPRGEKTAVGLGISRGHIKHPNMGFEMLNRFILHTLGVEISEENHVREAYPIYTRPPTMPPYMENMAFIGEAGGFVNPLTGGGIRTAIESAIALADAINRRNLKIYRRKIQGLRYAHQLLYIFREWGFSMGQEIIDNTINAINCGISGDDLLRSWGARLMLVAMITARSPCVTAALLRAGLKAILSTDNGDWHNAEP